MTEVWLTMVPKLALHHGQDGVNIFSIGIAYPQQVAPHGVLSISSPQVVSHFREGSGNVVLVLPFCWTLRPSFFGSSYRGALYDLRRGWDSHFDDAPVRMCRRVSYTLE